MDNLHIAMIMDGNRRWAVQQGMSKLEGHKYGAKKLEDVLEWCKELGVRELTLYTFSTENFNRSELEVKALLNLFREYFKRFRKEKKKLEGVKVSFIGDKSLFPEELQNLMDQIMDETKENSKYFLNFCMGYGGRKEILNAVNKAINYGKELNEEDFEEYLYLKDQPHIVVRTGGKVRTSNFLPWQTVYSEWFFPETYWPALTKQELKDIIEEFKNRKRNFGK